MKRPSWSVPVCVVAFMVLLSPDLLAKTAAVTLAELVQQSPVIVLGQIERASGSAQTGSRWVPFKPSQILRGDLSTNGGEIQLCNSPPSMREYPNLSRLTGDVVLFLSAEKCGCFEFSHTTTSVVEVRDGQATTAAIADEPIYQSLAVFLEKVRSLMAKQMQQVR